MNNRKEKAKQNLKIILDLKGKGFTNKEISKKLDLANNTITYYLKKVNYKHKKIKCKCKNKWCGKEFEIIEYKYNQKLHQYCKKCRDYGKKCKVCGKEHNNQGLTCSSKCAWVLKKESYIKSCGTEHNFSKESKSRKEWEQKMYINSGITNIFQNESIKNKCKNTLFENYGVYHNMNSPELVAERRLKAEKNGLFIPLNELSDFQIYKKNVLSFTLYNLRVFGENKFGENYRNKIGQYHVDHMFSIKEGYLQKVSPYIIGSIVNLQLLKGSNNISKGTKCDINKDKLINEYDNFEEKEKKVLKEMKNKRSKYYEVYHKMKKENED